MMDLHRRATPLDEMTKRKKERQKRVGFTRRRDATRRLTHAHTTTEILRWCPCSFIGRQAGAC